MLVELRPKSQITIPKELVDRLGLSEGDKLEIYEDDGKICIMPVVVYPKSYVDKLLKDVEEIKKKVASGEQAVFDNIDEMILSLEGEDSFNSIPSKYFKIKAAEMLTNANITTRLFTKIFYSSQSTPGSSVSSIHSLP